MEENLPPINPFVAPAFTLPSYEDFTKGASKVFVPNQQGGLDPRKPTLEEELNYFARKNQKSPNLQRELDRYSRSESEGFANPALPYDPRVDMVDAYAKYDPATWSKSFEKAWDTSVLNSFNSVKNIWQGVKEGIGRGDASAIFNNEYSRHLAEMTDNLEKMKPLYFTEEQQGSADQFLKQLFPALGYVVSSVVETAAVHAAATVVGGGYGAAVGAMAGGAGAVPGAIAGAASANVSALSRDAVSLGAALVRVGQTAKALNALSTAQKIKTGAQMLGTGLFMANGEAALNSQLARNTFLENQKRAHYETNGSYLSGEELTRVEGDADKVAARVFAMNLPLIAASNIFQFTNLVRGKAAPSIMEKLAFKIGKDGKAVAKNAIIKGSTEYLKESASEGIEELGQKVIEDYAINHFSQREENRRSFFNDFSKSLYDNVAGGGASDFLGGFLIGGASNIGTLGGIKAVHDNTKAFVDSYNTSTGAYFDNLGNQTRNNEVLKKAIVRGDKRAVADAFTGSLTDMVNLHAKIGSTEAFRQSLDSLSEMETGEFNKMFGLTLSDTEKATLVNGVTEAYSKAAKVRNDVDTAFQVNPYAPDNWFTKLIEGVPGDQTFMDKANKAWEVFKDGLTASAVKYDGDFADLNRRSMSFASFVNDRELYDPNDGADVVRAMFLDQWQQGPLWKIGDAEVAFNSIIERTDAAMSAGVEFSPAEIAVLGKLKEIKESKATGEEKLMRAFAVATDSFDAPGYSKEALMEDYLDYRLSVQSLFTLEDRMKSMRGRGMKRHLKRIVDAMDAYERGNLAGTPSAPSTPAEVEAPSPAPSAPSAPGTPAPPPTVPPAPIGPGAPAPPAPPPPPRTPPSVVEGPTTPKVEEQDAPENDEGVAPEDFTDEGDAAFYTEGIDQTVVVDESAPVVAPLSVEALAPAKPKKEKKPEAPPASPVPAAPEQTPPIVGVRQVADIFDRLSDGTFAPNEVKLAKMLEGLKEGETLYVDENVVGIYYGNKLINFFKKKDGKIFANVDEIDVPLPQNPLDALNYKEPPSEVERFVAATGLIGTELELFNRLLKNNIIILEC